MTSFGRGKIWSRTTGPYTLADILCRNEEQLSGLLLTLESLVCPPQKENLLSLRVSPFHPRGNASPNDITITAMISEQLLVVTCRWDNKSKAHSIFLQSVLYVLQYRVCVGTLRQNLTHMHDTKIACNVVGEYIRRQIVKITSLDGFCLSSWASLVA